MMTTSPDRVPPPDAILDALVSWFYYSAPDEEKDYEAYRPDEVPDNHIWLSIEKVGEWLDCLPGIEDARKRVREALLKAIDRAGSGTGAMTGSND